MMDRSGLRQLLADIAQAQREACETFIAASATRTGFACVQVTRRRVLRRDHRSARSATAARRHHGESRIRDKIRGIIADRITGGAVLE